MKHPSPPTTGSLPLDQILLGDCVQQMQALPEKSVDLVFADPPYNLQLQHELWRPNQTKVDAVDDAWDRFDNFEAYDRFTREWLSACRRLLKDTGTLWVIGSYHNIYRVGSVLQDLGYWILNDVVWIKTNPMPNFRGVRFTNAHETLLWAQKIRGERYTFHHHAMKSLHDDLHPGGLQMRSDWEIPICSGRERLKVNGVKAHSTQKPEALLYRVILSSSNPGDVVLDPFFGSGTTGAVAKKLRRRWIGIERDAAYLEVARQRIEAIPEASASEEVFTFPSKRSQRRVPFGVLIEAGYLHPGQRLYFGASGPCAVILANGTIACGERRGSIHQVGREILQAPCNGWDHWFYEDASSGARLTIDVLRTQYLADASERVPQGRPEAQLPDMLAL